ncbi:MAG: DUF4350 domain-containing protein [Acidobacteriota bacterium]
MATTDRKILTGATVLFLVLSGLAFMVSPVRTDPSATPTTYSAGVHGAAGAYLLLSELGYDVSRWERPPTELPEEPRGAILILAEPAEAISPLERDALRKFLASGGRILATGAGTASILQDWASRVESVQEAPWKDYPAVYPSDLSRGAPEISMTVRSRWRRDARRPIAIYGDAGDPVVAAARVGEGRFVWWAGPTPLTNAGIQATGNLVLFLNVIGMNETVEETRVLWDEYYHGHRGSLGSYMAATPVPWGLVQVGVIALAILATHARRFGPIVKPPVASRLTPLEFSETVGGLYERAGACSAVVGIAYHRFRSLLTRRLGIPGAVRPVEVSRRLRSRTGALDAGLVATLREAEAAQRRPDLEEWRALQLVRALHSQACKLGLISPVPKETP